MRPSIRVVTLAVADLVIGEPPVQRRLEARARLLIDDRTPLLAEQARPGDVLAIG